MSLTFRGPSGTPWKTIASEIVEGFGEAVVLIISTVAVLGLALVLIRVVAAVIVPPAMTLQEAK